MTTLNLQVGTSTNNDWWLQVGGGLNQTADVFAGRIGATIYNAALRFTGVTIAPGSTINTATIQVYNNASVGTPTLSIKAVDEDDSADSSGSLLNSRSRTTAAVAWSPDASGWTGYKTSPDIAAVIQEVVDRGGWASGNAIVIVLDDNGSASGNYVWGVDYEETAANAAKLDIDYTAGGGGGGGLLPRLGLMGVG